MARAERIALIVNPASRGGGGRRRGERAARWLEHHDIDSIVYETTPTTKVDGWIAHAAHEGATGIVVVGGDGSVREAVSGLSELADVESMVPWLGVVPSGTGGDFVRTAAREAGRSAPRDVDEALRRIVEGSPRRIDIGRCDHRDHEGRPRTSYFANIASFGMGGEVDRWVESSPKWLGGTAMFLAGTVITLFRFAPKRVQLFVDGADTPSFDGEILNVAVANGQYFGGGMRIAPDAKLDDGSFEFVIVRAIPTWETVRLTPSLYDGSHVRDPRVTVLRGKALRAVSSDATLLDIDGEPLGRLPATLTILPSRVELRG